MTLRFEPVPVLDVPWDDLDRRADRTVHQTRAWLEFLEATQGARPVVLHITDGGSEVGWFTGAIVRRYGVPILGSPMRGWSTAHMGFNLVDDDRIDELATALTRVAWSMGCWHLELLDRRVTDGPVTGFRGTPLHGLEVRLDVDDETLLAGMTAHGRRDVRRSLRLGATVEQVGDDATFAAEHYEQAVEVFGRRGLVPPYPQSRIESLIRHLQPAGLLVMLRVRSPDGVPISTALFAGLPGAGASFTLQASAAEGRRWYPNELIVWEGLRAWRDRGAVLFDFGGRDPGSATDFKRKFGGRDTTTWWLRRSRSPLVETGRAAAASAQRWRLRHPGMSVSARAHVD